MDELEKGKKNTEIRRDTQVRGSMGVPPSGGDDTINREGPEGMEPSEAESPLPDTDRMSER